MILLQYLTILSVHPSPTCSPVKWYSCVTWPYCLSTPPLPAALWSDTPAVLDHTFCPPLPYPQPCEVILLQYLIILSVHPSPTHSPVKWYSCSTWSYCLSTPLLPAALWSDTPVLLDHTVCPPLPYLQPCEVILLQYLIILSVHPSPTRSPVKWYSCSTWSYCLSTPPLPAALWSGTPAVLDHTVCPPLPYLQPCEVVLLGYLIILSVHPSPTCSSVTWYSCSTWSYCLSTPPLPVALWSGTPAVLDHTVCPPLPYLQPCEVVLLRYLIILSVHPSPYLQPCEVVLLRYLIILSVHPSPTCSSVTWYSCSTWSYCLSTPPLPVALWSGTPAVLDHTVCPPLPYLQPCEVVLLRYLIILSVHPSPTCSPVKWYSCSTWSYCLSTPPLPVAVWGGTPLVLEQAYIAVQWSCVCVSSSS